MKKRTVIKIHVTEQEIIDFPVESLQFSEFWSDLLAEA